MSYGLQIRGANGVVQIDTTYMGFETVDVLVLQSSTPTGSVSYPSLAGATIRCVQVKGSFEGTNDYGPEGDRPVITISYSSGYPVVSWSFQYVVTLSATVYVILETLPNSSYGLLIKNDSGNVLLTDRFASYGLFSTQVASAVAMESTTRRIDGLTVALENVIQYLVFHNYKAVFANIPAGSSPLFFVDVPNYPNGVQIRNVVNNNGVYTIRLVSFGFVPTVYAFIKQTHLADINGYGIRLKNSSGVTTLNTAAKILGLFTAQNEVAISSTKTDTTYLTLSALPAQPLMNAASCGHIFTMTEDGGSFLFPYNLKFVHAKVWSKANSTQLRCDFKLLWTQTSLGSFSLYDEITLNTSSPCLIANAAAYA